MERFYDKDMVLSDFEKKKKRMSCKRPQTTVSILLHIFQILYEFNFVFRKPKILKPCIA